MAFNSLEFFGFLAVVLALHYASRRGLRPLVLLAASYWFYAAWDWRFLGLIAVSTAIDWFVARRIEAATDARRRRLLLVASIVSNLGILAVFKYADFFVASFCALVGAAPDDHVLGIVLPVGISFFTFQSMSYTIDVYRGVVRARRSLLDVAVFVAFFPQLVAGPIVKAREFFPDYDDWRPPDDADLQAAATAIVTGLIQKAVLADNLAPIVDGYFGACDQAGWLPAATATLAFGAQIFFDFAGYSNIAIGAALLFGYRFPVNFRRPYLALSVADFWRRWHVSLSTWLRDYLYVPLGGNRGTVFATQRNLMLTMLLGGLWHGASWNFVIWGGLHGLYLAVHRGWRFVAGGFAERREDRRLYRLAAWALTTAAVMLAWVFFRCRELGDSAWVVRQLLWPERLGASLLGAPLLGVLAGTLVVARLADRRRLFERLDAADWRLRAVVFAAALFVLAVFAAVDAEVPFLYFRF